MFMGRKSLNRSLDQNFKFKVIFFGLFFSFFANSLLANPALALTEATRHGNTVTIKDKTFQKSDIFSQASQEIFIGEQKNGQIELVSIDKQSGAAEYFVAQKNNNKILNKKIIDQLDVEVIGGIKGCDVPVIGFVLCPMIDFMGSSIDWIISWIDDWLQVKPFLTTNSVFYQYWQAIKNIANIAFIGFFLIMALSHLTNVGISNYELKKMLPKIIVYAVLVNLSFYLAALAIDISNVVGQSLAQLFIGLSPERNTNVQEGWSLLAEGLVGGSSVVVGVGAAGSSGAAIFAIAPIMFSAILSALATFVTLSVRQVLIVSLAILSPAALVFSILPSTEKIWKKYLELFKQLLLLFPIFALLHGFSVLVSRGILNINEQVTLTSLVFALIIKLVPIFVLPKLLKTVNSTLGNAYDKIRNNAAVKKAESAADEHFKAKRNISRNKALANANKLKWYNLSRNLSKTLNDRKKVLEQNKATWQSEADARLDETMINAKKGSFYYKSKILAREAEERKKMASAKLLENIESIINSVDREAFNDPTNNSLAKQLATRAMQRRTAEAAKDMAISTTNTAYLDFLEKRDGLKIKNYDGSDLDLLKDAAGIAGKKGETKYLARMLNEREEGIKKHINNTRSIIKRAEEENVIDFMTTFRLAAGELTDEDTKKLTDFGIDLNSDLTTQAAISQVFATKDLGNIHKVMAKSASGDYKNHRDLIAKLILEEKVFKNARYLGERTIDDMRKGLVNNGYLDNRIMETIRDKKYSLESIATEDIDSVKNQLKAITKFKKALQTEDNSYFTDTFGKSKSEMRKLLQSYQETIKESINHEEIGGKFRSDAKDIMETISNMNF